MNADPPTGAVAPRTLVAEDNTVIRTLLKSMLTRCNLDPDLVSNGQEAVDAVRSRPYDLIFMDMQMPVMDGAEAIQTIRRALSPEEQPVIIIHSAHLLDGGRDALERLGADAFLSKPFRLASIRELVAGVISNHLSFTGPTEENGPLLDDPLLREWKDDWEGGFQEILRDFLKEVPGMHDHLVELHHPSTLDEAARQAHALKGSCANFGFLEYAKRMAIAESQLKRGEPLPPRFLDDARTVLEESITAIRNWPKP